MTEELNLPCRYKVLTNSNYSSYTFRTDTQAEYVILFDPADGLFSSTSLEGEEVYHIVISKTKEGTGLRDSEIENTVSAIIEHFFREKQRILIYSCDTMDNKHKERNRLFGIWYGKNGERLDLVKLDSEIQSEDHTYYTGLIYHKDNPCGAASITSSFEEINYSLQEDKA